MIFTQHGIPCLQLIKFLELWKAHSGKGYTSSRDQLQEGWLAFLTPNSHPDLMEGDWLWMLKDEEGGFKIATRLYSRVDERGETFLAGLYGMGLLVIRKVPPRNDGKKSPALVAYWAAKIPTRWHMTQEEFDE